MSKDELIKILTELKKSSMNDENVISQINDIEKIIELKNAKEEEMLKFKEMMEEDFEIRDERLINLEELVANARILVEENKEALDRNGLIVHHINLDTNIMKREIELINLRNEEIKKNMSSVSNEKYQAQFNEELNNNMNKISELNNKIDNNNNLANRYNEYIVQLKEQDTFLNNQLNTYMSNLDEYKQELEKANKKEEQMNNAVQVYNSFDLVQNNLMFNNYFNNLENKINNNNMDENSLDEMNEYKNNVSDILLLNAPEKRNEEIIKNTMAKNYYETKNGFVSSSQKDIDSNKEDINIAKINLKIKENQTQLVKLDNIYNQAINSNENLNKEANKINLENKILRKRIKNKNIDNELKIQLQNNLSENEKKLIEIKAEIKNNEIVINENEQAKLNCQNKIDRYKVLLDNKEHRKQNEQNTEVLQKEEKINNNLIIHALNTKERMLNSEIPMLLGNLKDQTKYNTPLIENDPNVIEGEFKVLNDDVEENKVDEVVEKEEIVKEPEQFEILSVKRPLKEKMKAKIKKVSAAIVASMLIIASAGPAIVPNQNNMEEVNTRIIENIEEEKLTGNETVEEIAEKIGINDTITVKEDASIYYTQYDATEKTNALDPVHEREMERNVIGATVKMPDGSLQFTQNNEMLDSLVNNGGEITSYLTGNEHEAEGFWNVNDINKVNQMNQEMGGMTR